MSTVESVTLLFRHLTNFDNWLKGGSSVDSRLPPLSNCDEAPKFLVHNPYILRGYRASFNAGQCVRSAFHWTNETVNIWTHGAFLILFLYYIGEHLTGESKENFGTGSQRAVALLQLTLYAFTMGTSVFYHTFCCVSKDAFRQCYLVDVLGIISGSVANYINGIFYLFECYPGWRIFYMGCTFLVAVFLIRSVVKCMKVGDPEEDYNRFILLCVWVASSALIPGHCLYLGGQIWTAHSAIFIPRVLGFYGMTSAAFIAFVGRIPERLCPGSVDFIGHSHQWWHIFSAGALYWWYQSAVVFAKFSNNHLECRH